MKSTALVASLIAVCSIGCVVSSASAKSAGGGGAAIAGGHGGLRAGGPAFFHGVRPAVPHGIAAKHALRPIGLRRRISALPYLPGWSGYGDFAPYYYYPPTDAAVADGGVGSSASEPVAASQQPPTRVLVVTPGCRTEEQKVQSEAGGETVIHIRRCY
jgi:hypothetical protein